MKITIYELLGMIKDDKVPEVIKYNGLVYYKEIDGYYTTNELKLKLSIMNNLNDEVEIIEQQEHKIPEKLDQTLNRLDMNEDYYRYIMENRFKINEIIDYLEGIE